MRIVLVNWARIWDGASHGGGVNGYCQALAISLLQRGHEVVSLFGGITHVREPRACVIRRHADWLAGTEPAGGAGGVRVFEVVNSPVLAPSIQQFQEPLGEVSAPELEETVGRFFEQVRPDVVHWHNIEGFSIGCVERARAAGARVVYSLHNYHTICPQVYLMQRHREACFDFDNGHACDRCIQTSPVSVERERRIEEYLKSLPPRPDLARERREAIAELRSGVSWMKRTVMGAARLAAAGMRSVSQENPAMPLPGAAAETAEQVSGAMAAPEPDSRGQTAHILAQMRPHPGPDLSSPEYRPLLNVIQPEPTSQRAPNDYARRRSAMVQMLNRCDRVLAVSDFVRRKFESMGVEEGRIATMPIGSRINKVVAHHHRLVFPPPPIGSGSAEAQRAVRLVFMGYNHYYKGLGVFAESLETLAPEYMRRIDLSVYALDGQGIEWMFRRMEPRLARLTFQPGYQYNDIPWMLGGKDLGVVCSVWWDNAPQTVFEFQACGLPVLGAEVGGIPDFVKDGHNGLLFRANDRAALARRIMDVLDDPAQLDRLRANVRPPKDIDDHAVEMEGVYGGAAQVRRPKGRVSLG